MVDVDIIVAAIVVALIFRWFLFRMVHAVWSWRYSGRFIDLPSDACDPAPLSVTPYNADHVVHAVGGWEYYKMRLGIGPGPRALCGYRLYTDVDIPGERRPENAPSCADCDQVWSLKHPATRAMNDG